MANERTYWTQRLAKVAPLEHLAVEQGEKRLYGALVDVGLRPRRVTVEIDRPESLARCLRRHMSSEQLDELRELLNDPAGAC